MRPSRLARAIIEAVDDKERDAERDVDAKDVDRDEERDELGMAGPSDIDKVVPEEPVEDPPFAPDANMMIKDDDEPPVSDAGDDVERLAAAAHEAWSGWMEYLFGKSEDNEDGSVTIPADQVERWRRQTATSYAELSEEEKESDREEARKYIAALAGPEEEPATREPYHSLDMHDGPGEDDGW